jgi:hypothetical protein
MPKLSRCRDKPRALANTAKRVLTADNARLSVARRAASGQRGYEPGFPPKASIKPITRRRTAGSLIRMKAFMS